MCNALHRTSYVYYLQLIMTRVSRARLNLYRVWQTCAKTENSWIYMYYRIINWETKSKRWCNEAFRTEVYIFLSGFICSLRYRNVCIRKESRATNSCADKSSLTKSLWTKSLPDNLLWSISDRCTVIIKYLKFQLYKVTIISVQCTCTCMYVKH